MAGLLVWRTPSSLLAAPLPAGDTLPGRVVAERIARGPAVAVYHETAEPLIAVRLSFALADDPRAGELAGILQWLARPAAESQAAALGARLELSRSHVRAVYSIVGPATEFSALLAILRRASDWPEPTAVSVEAARLAVATRDRQATETPEPLLRRQLAAELFAPATDSTTTETEDSREVEAGSLSPGELRDFWARSFRPERLQAVVVGGVGEDAVQAFRDWPAPSAGSAASASSTDASGTPAASGAASTAGGYTVPGDARTDGPQVVFPWAAVAFRSDAGPAALLVVAHMARQRLTGLPIRSARAEAWWGPRGRAVMLLGSSRLLPAAATAAPDSVVSAAMLAGVLDGVRAELTPARVAEARQAVLRDLMFAARTPTGLASFLGTLFERTDDPQAGQELLRTLDALDTHTVAAALDSMLEATPVSAEIRP